MDTISWYRSLTAGDSVNAVAQRAKIGQSTLDRQIKRGELSVESVASIARAYDADVIDSLIKAGFITEEEVRAHSGRYVLADLSDRILSDEVWRRMAAGHQID